MNSEARKLIIAAYRKGDDAAAIYAEYAVDPRHLNDVRASDTNTSTPDLKAVFLDFELLYGAQWNKGPLAETITQMANPELNKALLMLQGSMMTNGQWIGCNHKPKIGQAFSAITNVAFTLVPEAEQADFLRRMTELSGGRIFEGLTVESVQEVINDTDRSDSVDRVITRHNRGAAAARRAKDQKLTPAEIEAAAVTAESSEPEPPTDEVI